MANVSETVWIDASVNIVGTRGNNALSSPNITFNIVASIPVIIAITNFVPSQNRLCFEIIGEPVSRM